MLSFAAHARKGERDPNGVAGEQVVVFGRAQMADEPEFNYEVVDEFLRLRFGQNAFFEIAFNIDVEEFGDAADRVGGAVLLFDRAEIAEIEPLNRFARVRRRLGDIVAVGERERLELGHEFELLGEIFQKMNRLFVENVFFAELRFVVLLLLDEVIHAVERDAAVVADNAPARVRVRKARQNARVARFLHRVVIRAENARIVRRTVREFIFDLFGHLVPVRVARLNRVPEARERRDAALERRVRLKPDDNIGILIDDVAGLVRQDREDFRRVDVENAALLVFRDKELFNALHFLIRALGRALEERGVAVVLRIVQFNEVRDVDSVAPNPFAKSAPSRFIFHVRNPLSQISY